MDLFATGIDPPADGGLRDPAFAENKSLPIHRWVPWIAGYSAAFVDDVLATYIPRNAADEPPAVVLDPFAGVGTTLVQAMLRGYQTVGFEINPYAALAAQVKVRAPFLDLSKLKSLIDTFERSSRKWWSKPKQACSVAPKGFRSRIPFFSPAVEQQVLCILDFINEIEVGDLSDLFRVAFGSVMVRFSNYTYEPSLGTRPGAGKPLIENEDAAAILVEKLHQIIRDIEWVQAHVHPHLDLSTSHQVFNANFMTAAERQLSDRPVDLMITSPPYMNNYHYVRNTRPQLYWLSLANASSALKQLEEENFGKFWQTVRTAVPLEPRFTHSKLHLLIRQLQQIRVEKGPYGGPGWANYVTAYFNDAQRFFGVLESVLKPRGVGVIVIGNSIIQGIEFRVDEFFAELAEREGLIAEGVHPIRQKRVGASITQSSVRRGERNGATLYESAVIVRKSCG
ncbi:MAG: site-specific DNA-methyltransferase [Candidatus Tectomicrobia bacterium]|uniref:site-specific DNA-methyltransferase (cytosine-N(4)-specific) n=1 Tax=Tectimicrobiota bacterium TaxID=2528274 RepID=A0A932G0F7_UNCTE|nr:site-specific DNA-methyltransferase [Candidatus Tectomicrobia bacterium]